MDKILKSDLTGLDEELKNKIREAADTLDAIKNNKIDAIVVNTEAGEKVLTLHDTEDREDLSNKLIDFTSEAILVCDNNGKILRYNKAALNLAVTPFQYPEIDSIYNLSTIKGEPISVKNLPPNNDLLDYEIKFKRKDGKLLFLNLSKELLKDVHGDTYGFVVTLNDITKHMLAEMNALDMLKEKTMLLKEIHHRVKNSLQIMSSIIGLQSNNITDPVYQGMFADLKARLKSISLIHEKLYQSESISEIKMDWYIVDLVKYLRESYELNNNVEFNFSIDPIFMVPERVINIGLIINELITNSIKYAFPTGKGNIWISMKQQGNQTILKVRDNGIGIPESIDINHSDSLGMKLITVLTEHLGGNLELIRNNGTEVKIIFNITTT